MNSLTSEISFHNSKLFFSRIELNKILACYSLGVSRGNWKDYAINFYQNEAIFYIYKHSLASPDCILIKFKEKRKKKVIFSLSVNNKKNSKYDNIDSLITSLKRKHLKLI